MKRTFQWVVLVFVALALILTWSGCAAPTAGTPVIDLEIIFSDGLLQDVVREACGNPEQVTMADLEGITTLDCSNTQFITTLKGIEHLKNLEILILSNNPLLTSLEPLKGLNKLQKLYIEYDSALKTANLVLPDSLTTIDMSETDFTDINFMTGLPNLVSITMNHCPIDSLQALVANRKIAKGVTIDLADTPTHKFIYIDPSEGAVKKDAFKDNIVTLQKQGVTITGIDWLFE